MRHLVKVYLFFFFLGPVLFSETQVSISSTSNLATIGDKIHLKIVIKSTSNVQDVKISTEMKDFEVISKEIQKPRKQEDDVVVEVNVTVTFFKTGDYEIGPFKIELINNNEVIETKHTNAIPITIKSVLKEADKDIKPLKELIEIKGNPFYILKYIIVFLFGVFLAFLIFLWIKGRKRRAEIPLEPVRSPLEELDVRIEELIGLKLFEKGNFKEFFIRLTAIIKRFIFRTYRFKAEDFTTYETLTHLKRKESEVLMLNHMEFNISDLVKFAKFIPDSDISDEVIIKIKDVIVSYKKRIMSQENLK